MVLDAKPGRPPWEAEFPVPCAIPPSRAELEKICDVRYGWGSTPASPYAARSLPYESQRCSPISLVNSQATLPLGNQLRKFDCPNVDEPSLRTAAVRCTWLYMSNVPCPNQPAVCTTSSASMGSACVTVFDSLNGWSAAKVSPVVPSKRVFRAFRFWPTVTEPAKSGLIV